MSNKSAAALFALLAVVVTWPQARHLAHGVEDFGDPLHFAWTLGWIAHAIVASPRHLFDANVLFPEPLTLAYSETLVLPGIVLAPLIWIGADPILVVNLLLLGAYVVSGLAVFVLVRRLTDDDGAALVAGAIFAVYPYRIEQYPHVQMQLVFLIPFALVLLHRLIAAPGWRVAVWLGVVLAAECYTCVSYALYGGVTIAVVAITLMVADRRRTYATVLASLATASVVAALLAAPMGSVYAAASRIVGERSVQDLVAYSAEPRDYLAASPDDALYGDDAHPGVAERRLFPGYAGPAMALAAFVPPFGAATVAYGLAGAAAFDLSLGVNGFGYAWLHEHFKPLRGVRVPARFGMLVGLSIAVLAGIGMARVLRGRGVRVRWAVVALAIGVVTLEARMRPVDFVSLPERTPSVYKWLAAQPPSVVCEYPVGNLQGRIGPQDETYMYYSTIHWQRLVNGDTGFMPPSYVALHDHLTGFPDDRSIAYLRERHVDLLLVHSGFYINGDFHADLRALRARSDLEWVGEFRWRNGDLSEAFRVK